jgi:hypothetical protein
MSPAALSQICRRGSSGRLAGACRVGEPVHRDDSSLSYREPSDREGLAVSRRDHSHGAVDERRLHGEPELRIEHMEASSLLGGILTFAIFPLALPGLLLFVIAPLALVAMVGVLLATPLVLPLWLARVVLRRRSSRRSPAVPVTDEIRIITARQSSATP